jgi:hypothetical protein
MLFSSEDQFGVSSNSSSYPSTAEKLMFLISEKLTSEITHKLKLKN